jgi:hypothetical protein
MLGKDGPFIACLSVCDRHALPVLRFVEDHSALAEVEPPVVVGLEQFRSLQRDDPELVLQTVVPRAS